MVSHAVWMTIKTVMILGGADGEIVNRFRLFGTGNGLFRLGSGGL